MQIAKWTAEGAVNRAGISIRTKYSATRGHTSVAGNMIVFHREHGEIHETRWQRGNFNSSLTDRYIWQGRFFMTCLPDLHTRTTGGKQHVSRFADSKTDRSGRGVQACAGVPRDSFRYVYAGRGDADFEKSQQTLLSAGERQPGRGTIRPWKSPASTAR